MKLKMTLLAVAAAGMWSTAPMAQPTHSPNPNKAQNSDMRTQSGMHPAPHGYTVVVPAETVTVMPAQTVTVMPADTTVTVVPARPVWVEPTASRRGTMGYGPTHSPNPNKAQNSNLRTQGGDTIYYYAPGEAMYYFAPSEIQSGPTHTPNPNKVQNNGVPTQY